MLKHSILGCFYYAKGVAMSEENGVTVTVREIYDSLNKITDQVTGLGYRFDRLEEEIKTQNEKFNEAKRTSDKAIELANTSHYKADDAKKSADAALKKARQVETDRYNDQIEENKQSKSNRVKFYTALASSAIPWVVMTIMGIIFIAKNNGF